MSEAMTPMPQYRSHKKVWALQIASVTLIGCDSTTDENPIVEVTFADPLFSARKFNLRGKPTPEAGWYFIQYEDGYESFSPPDAFEKGHTPVTGYLSVDVVQQASSATAQKHGAANVLNELLAASDPFKRVLAINHPFLNGGDDKPLRDFIAGVWPTWGEYKRLMTAISLIDEAKVK